MGEHHPFQEDSGMSPTVTSSLQPANCACDAAFGIVFTSESRFAVVGVWGIGIRLIEVETGETVALLEAARKPSAHVDLNLSSDGTLLTAAVDHAGFCVWDMRVVRRQLAALGLESAAFARSRSDGRGNAAYL